MTEATWNVLADPSRRALLDLIRVRPRPVGELVEEVGLSQPATSKHLRVLRDGGFVTVDVDGQRRIYAVNPEAFTAIDEWLAPYRQMWNPALDRLGAYLNNSAH